MDAPAFDPTAPFLPVNVAGQSAAGGPPPFDPSQPFQKMERPTLGERAAAEFQEGFQGTVAGTVAANMEAGAAREFDAERLQSLIEMYREAGAIPRVEMANIIPVRPQDLDTMRDMPIQEAQILLQEQLNRAGALGRQYQERELARQQAYAAMPSAEGVLENVVAGGAQLAGAAASPESLVPVTRGANMLGTLAKGAGVNAGLNVATDPLVQMNQQDLGVRDAYDWRQTALSGLVGGVAGGTLNVAPEALGALARRLGRIFGKSEADVTLGDVDMAARNGDAEARALMEDPAIRSVMEANNLSPDDPRAHAFAERVAARRQAEAQRDVPPVTEADVAATNAELAPSRIQRDPRTGALDGPGMAAVRKAPDELTGEQLAAARAAGQQPPAKPVPDVIEAAPPPGPGRPAYSTLDTAGRPEGDLAGLRAQQAEDASVQRAFDMADVQRRRGAEYEAGRADAEARFLADQELAELNRRIGEPADALVERQLRVPREQFRKMPRDARERLVSAAQRQAAAERPDPRVMRTSDDAMGDAPYDAASVPPRATQKVSQQPAENRRAPQQPTATELGMTAGRTESGRFYGRTATGAGDRPFFAEDSTGRPTEGFEARAREQADAARRASEEDLLRQWEQRRREEAGRRYAGGDQRAREGAAYSGKGQAKSFSPEANPGPDGRFETDEFKFVRSTKGGPIKFATQQQAARWIVNRGHKTSPDQVFEIENHPSGQGFTVRERGRAEAKPEEPATDAGPAYEGEPNAASPATRPEPVQRPQESEPAQATSVGPEAEAATSTPADAAKMTLDEYREARAAELRSEYPEADEFDIQSTLYDVENEWRGALVRAGEKERLPDRVLDDAVALFGEMFLRNFRGTSEIGASGYIKRDIRNSKTDAPKATDNRVENLKKKPWQRTWPEQRAAEFGSLNYKPSPQEFKVAKAKHRAAVEAANLNRDPVPDNVLKEAGLERAAPLSTRKSNLKNSTTLSANPFGEAARVAWDWAGEAVDAWRGSIREFAEAVGAVSAEHGQGQRGVRGLLRVARNLEGAILDSSDGEIRAIAKRFKSATLDEIVNMFHATAGKAGAVGRTFDEAVSTRINQRTSDLARILEPVRGNKDSLRQVVKLVQSGGALDKSKPVHAAALKLRALLKEELEYMREAGVEIGEIPAGYYPRVFNDAAIAAKPREFQSAVAEAYRASGLNAKDAAAAAVDLVNEILLKGQNDNLFVRVGGSINSNFTKGRKLSKEADDILEKFYITDPQIALAQYVTSATRRAEVARRFGDGWSKWPEMVEKLRAEGAGDAIEPLMRHIRVCTGINPPAFTPGVESVLSWTRTWTALMLLEKATLTSLSDMLVPSMRSGNIGDLIRGIGYTAVEAFHGASKSAVARRQMAEDFGLIVNSMNDTILSARFVGGSASSQLQAKVLNKFFTRTGLEALTRGSRLSAMEIGRTFIRRLALDIADSGAGSSWRNTRNSSVRFMSEIGIPEEKADGFAKWLLKHNKGMPDLAQITGEMGELYRTAVIRFTDQSVMRPSAATRPRWASHSLGKVVYQLMSFIQAFQKNVLNRAGRMAWDAVTEKDLTLADRARLMWPMAMMPILAVAQYGVGEVRDKYLGDPVRRREEDMLDKIFKASSRAGLTGITDPFVNLVTGTRYGRDVVTSLVGPGLGAASSGLQATIDMVFHNSDQTNATERRSAKALYDLGIEPLTNLLITAAPGGSLIAAGTTQAVGSGWTREQFITALAGEKSSGKKKRVRAGNR